MQRPLNLPLISAVCIAALVDPPMLVRAADCNSNGVDDALDIAGGTSQDCDSNGAPDECALGSGLQGFYYNGTDLSLAAVTRIDPTIDFQWSGGSPDPAIRPDTFSVRWVRQVLAAHTEEYTFHTTTDDGVRLWVDGGEARIEYWDEQPPTERSGTGQRVLRQTTVRG